MLKKLMCFRTKTQRRKGNGFFGELGDFVRNYISFVFLWVLCVCVESYLSNLSLEIHS